MSSDRFDTDDLARPVEALAEALASYHQRYEAERDPRAVFAYAYLNITLDLAERLAREDTGFEDPAWVSELAVAFGAHYTRAMDAIDDWEPRRAQTADDRPETVPRPWADVYLAITSGRATVLEALAFSMGAHITYDLPLALVDVGTETDRIGDYHQMNDVLASNAEVIRDAVTRRYTRVLWKLIPIVGGRDTLVSNYWIRVGRSLAWYNATRLQSPTSRPDAEASIERSVANLIESVQTGGPAPLHRKITTLRLAVPYLWRWPAPPGTETSPWQLRW